MHSSCNWYIISGLFGSKGKQGKQCRKKIMLHINLKGVIFDGGIVKILTV